MTKSVRASRLGQLTKEHLREELRRQRKWESEGRGAGYKEPASFQAWRRVELWSGALTKSNFFWVFGLH